MTRRRRTSPDGGRLWCACSGSLVPLAREQAEERAVRDLGPDLPALPQETFALEPQALERAQGSLVPRIGVGFETAGAERPERIVDDRGQRLLHVSLLPVRTRQSIADLADRALLAKMKQGGVAQEGIVLVAHDRPANARVTWEVRQ